MTANWINNNHKYVTLKGIYKGFPFLFVMGKVSDYIKANRKASRELEIEFFGKQITHHKIYKSKKVYDRNKFKKIEI